CGTPRRRVENGRTPCEGPRLGGEGSARDPAAVSPRSPAFRGLLRGRRLLRRGGGSTGLDRRGVARGGDDAVAPRPLGVVQRAIRAADQGLHLGVLRPVSGDAGGNGDARNAG